MIQFDEHHFSGWMGWFNYQLLGGGSKHVLFIALPGEMIQFDEHIFRNGLVQPPTTSVFG